MQKNNLVSPGFVNVTYPSLLATIIAKSVPVWRQFCALPTDTKQMFACVDDGNLDGSGYELKQQKKICTHDLKENFHVTLNAYENLNRMAQIINQSHVVELLHKSRSVIEALTPLVLEFATFLEKDFEVEKLWEEVRASQQNWFLRYLHYFPGAKPAEEIASAHADKSGFTLHLYESDEGLEYLEHGKVRSWKKMPVLPGSGVIIPNMQLQYKTKGMLKALYHRVVATEDSAQLGRYSIVCFIPFLETPMYNKVSRGRVQDLAPGFNYAMPHEDFSQLFA